MNPVAHHNEDKLLEFAYGELAAHEAKAVEAHLKGCSRCTEALNSIRSVRTAMGSLPVEHAPDAGLDSLLAYAQQTARRQAAGPAPRPAWWRRWVAPLAGAIALALVGVVAFQANQATELKAPKDLYQVKDKEQAAAPKAQQEPAADRGDWPREKNDYRGGEFEGALGAAAAPAPELEEPVAKLSKSKALRSSELSREEFSKQRQVESKKGWGAEAERKALPQAAAKPAPLMGNVGERAVDDLFNDGADLKDEKANKETVAAVQAPPQSSTSLGVSLGTGRTMGGSAPTGSNAATEEEDPLTPSSMPAARSASLEQQAQKKKSDPEDEARRRAAGWESLLVDARKAEQNGDRVREVRLAHEVLARGATGYARVEALKRLCDGYDALQAEDKATPYCLALLKEFPSSAAAKQVADRKAGARQQRVKNRSSVDFAEEQAPAEADQASEPAKSAY